MKDPNEILLENEKAFKSLFEHATISILVTDEKGDINLVNPNAEKLFGYTKEELTGKSIELLIPEQLKDKHRHYRQQYFKAPKARPMGLGKDLFALDKNGRTFPVEISLGYYKLGRKKMAVAFITDVSERKKAEEILRSSEETTRLIMNSALDAIVCIDTDGYITVWNPQAEKIFGWLESEVKGHRLSETIIPVQYRALHEAGLKRYLTTRQHTVINKLIEISALNRNGKEFPIELTIIPMRQKDNDFFCAFIRDITERRDAEARQKEYAEDLKRKNIELEQFAYVASHDLQEPLRTVSGFVELLKRHYKDQADESVTKYINYITDASDRMRRLVQDLLDYSRLGRQRILEPIDCNQVVADVLSDLTMAIQESQAVIHKEQLPVISGYATEIKQLFQNLISNSLKFRKPGEPPVISISVIPNENHWQFNITDNGIGIEEKYWERIFVIFQRLHTKAEYEGTGIGLAHCKKITELHNGKIWLDSTPDSGSTFYFTVRKRSNDTWVGKGNKV
ncbi:PAS domain S-box protein [Niastella caeni]|uniref:histidine kinase n=1 Tax=Niastella caeni TaxID=2569763 RepID=A0A4S8I1H6_9BACT|nr:PAS domain S-box protein [Niastella caeni]THU41907.1 PAS domain S-box protein [Niastella caeni]